MSRLALRIGIAVGAVACAAAAASACFPDYEVGGGGDGGAPDVTLEGAISPEGSGGTHDGPSSADGGGSGSSGSSSGGSTSGSSSGSGSGSSGGGPGDASVAVIPKGTYSFQALAIDGGLVDATATIDYALAIDRYEVTVGRFQAYVDAGMPVPEAGTVLDPKYPSMTWQHIWNVHAQSDDYENATQCGNAGGKGPTWGLGNPLYPINCVTWDTALAFCAWDGNRRLPTDTEWRIAATSEGHRTPYPWGTQSIDCGHAIYGDGHACGFPIAVGSAPQGITADGVYDLVGSLSEWLWDYVDWYSYPSNPPTDYAGPDADTPNSRVWIGGDYGQQPSTGTFYVYQPGPFSSEPESFFDNTGFRCARSQ